MYRDIAISKISYHLPRTVETNKLIKKQNPEWDVDKIELKTGIKQRYISGIDETAVDLATSACFKLLKEHEVDVSAVDAIILVTQSPDYTLPTSACIIQNRLNLPKSVLAFDINLGCSGFVNALSVAASLITAGTVSNCLVVCAETYTKYIDEADRANRMLFSDAAAACLVEKAPGSEFCIGPFVFGSDGSGANELIVKGSGARKLVENEKNYLFMDGANVLLFALRVVPLLVKETLKKTGVNIHDIDVFVFHQASELVIKTLIDRLSIPESKALFDLKDIGNTVSCTLPIALSNALDQNKIKRGNKVMLIGFGVGYSWGSSIITWGDA